MKAMLVTTVAIVCVLTLFASGVALAQTNWVDELTGSVNFYKTNYPNSNWDPYLSELSLVKEALAQGDQRIVRSKMGKWFKMLRNRDYGIHDVAADELFNFGLMVTPIQEFNISVPAPAAGGF
jgi:cytochrome b subunit of formate dehydrogenase